MNAELKAKWIKALRSGKYKQGTGYLKREDLDDRTKTTHCCLGVLCEITDVSKHDSYGGVYSFGGPDAMAGATTYLPDEIKGEISSEQQKTLATMNDEGSSFEQIAEYIEKNL